MKNEDGKGSSSLIISLPKQQPPLPKTGSGERYDDHIDAVIKGLSRTGPPPAYALIRIILCVGYPLDKFQEIYKPLFEVEFFLTKESQYFLEL